MRDRRGGCDNSQPNLFLEFITNLRYRYAGAETMMKGGRRTWLDTACAATPR
jgi:hypothetical protein